MKKVLIIASSDVLGIPAIMKLKQLHLLGAVAVPDKLAQMFIPVLKSLGIDSNELHIITKKNLTAELKSLLTVYDPAAVFVFTLPWLLPSEALALLPGRFLNFHFGLLPKYKGADPIFWQIRNGEQNCGLTVHIMTPEVDAGPIVFGQEIPIIPGETYGYNTRRLGALGSEAVMNVIKLLEEGNLQPTTMTDEGSAPYPKKPSQADLTINWQRQTATDIENLVNASNPRYQGVISSIKNMQIRLLEVSQAEVNNPEKLEFAAGANIHPHQPYGSIVACINRQFLKINVVYMQEGYFSGSRLFALGFSMGDVFS